MCVRVLLINLFRATKEIPAEFHQHLQFPHKSHQKADEGTRARSCRCTHAITAMVLRRMQGLYWAVALGESRTPQRCKIESNLWAPEAPALWRARCSFWLRRRLLFIVSSWWWEGRYWQEQFVLEVILRERVGADCIFCWYPRCSEPTCSLEITL